MHDYIHTKPNQTSPAITPITEPIIQTSSLDRLNMILSRRPRGYRELEKGKTVDISTFWMRDNTAISLLLREGREYLYGGSLVNSSTHITHTVTPCKRVEKSSTFYP
ncbi:uncharacterized protein RAG0_03347 [Rhynchosporium agropyri]|uniref:Uncharacterized protein n=1 Tax=Rhynchosporium agropyri TaxID=914238 RepID=A0A1E1K415_9HELO|nr:uncharacterized protein RAG0_03347 [Rhynchosporium agropyri]